MTSGCLDPEAVIIDARREATPGPRRRDRRTGLRPASTSLSDYDELLTGAIQTTTTKPATADAAAQNRRV